MSAEKETVQPFGPNATLKMLTLHDDEIVREVAAQTLDRVIDLTFQVRDTCARAEKAEALLRECDIAINPPDKRGISLDTWHRRLTAVTEKIRDLFKASEPQP